MTSPELAKPVTYYRAALTRITKRLGRFSLDPHEHANNTIDGMAQIAEDALNGVWEPPDE